MEELPTLLSGIEGSGGRLPVIVSYSDRSSIHSSMSSSFSDLCQGSNSENPDLDLTGLVESTVDSDDEDTVSESASVSLSAIHTTAISLGSLA